MGRVSKKFEVAPWDGTATSPECQYSQGKSTVWGSRFLSGSWIKFRDPGLNLEGELQWFGEGFERVRSRAMGRNCDFPGMSIFPREFNGLGSRFFIGILDLISGSWIKFWKANYNDLGRVPKKFEVAPWDGTAASSKPSPNNCNSPSKI